jgi:hypothetical protein
MVPPLHAVRAGIPHDRSVAAGLAIILRHRIAQTAAGLTHRVAGASKALSEGVGDFAHKPRIR